MMNTQKFRFAASRRLVGLALAGFAAAALAADPSATLPDKFEAPKISSMPLSIGGVMPPNIVLLMNTGSFTHFGMLPTTADRYDLLTAANGSIPPTGVNKPYHSSHINKIYYDPSVEYKKPLGFIPGTTTEWPDVPFTDAPIDGFGVLNWGLTVKTKNLSNNFHATWWRDTNVTISDVVYLPEYKTDGAAGPGTGTAIGAVAHYNLYHPGRVKYNADGSKQFNPSVLDANGNETWQDIRLLPQVTQEYWHTNTGPGDYPTGNRTAIVTQRIVNQGGEAHLTYGTPENPARTGCVFQDVAMYGYTDYSKYGKFGSSNASYVFPGAYGSSSVYPPVNLLGVGSTSAADVARNAAVHYPQTQFTNDNRTHNWILRYYNCFEAIRVGEAEDKDEYYPWWNVAERGPMPASAKQQNFANWYSYYYHPGSLMKTVLTHVLDDLDPETRVGYAVTSCGIDKLSGSGKSSDVGCPRGSVQGASWLGNHYIDGDNAEADYVRRGVRPFRDFDPDDPSGYGSSDACPATITPATARGQCRTQLLNWLFGLYGSSHSYAGHAGMRKSLAAVGTYYTNHTLQGPWSSTPGFIRAASANAEASRYQACRKSYVLTLTGGNFSNDDTDPLGGGHSRDADSVNGVGYYHANVYDANGSVAYGYTAAPPFADGLGGRLTTMADVAMIYWKTDLLDITWNGRSNNNVPRSTIDPAFWQHMNVLAIHLDDAHSVDWKRIAKGLQNPASLPTVLAGDWGYPNGSGGRYVCESNTGCTTPNKNWGNPDYSDLELQPNSLLNGDDLMHAAINSRGFYAATL
ncbi:MAG: hypothetical protein LBJ59_10470, partial [Zoogloeaceae bacterium]|nr:hypothetical protein [Zoogloeaceae bacterium]